MDNDSKNNTFKDLFEKLDKKSVVDDMDVWLEYVKNTKPIKKKNSVVLKKESQQYQRPIINNLQEYNNSSNYSISKPNLKDFKNIIIDSSLDLHGYRLENAQLACFNFIKQAYFNGKKYVLIVTGKGSLANPSIIRENFGIWMNSLSQYVVSYTHAKQSHGGNGAFYVKIRKINKK